MGMDCKDRHQKHQAKSAVMAELEQVTDKQLCCSQSILSSIVIDLAKERGFNELLVLIDTMQLKIVNMDHSIASATTILSGMSKSFNLATAKLLTAVCAVLDPP